MNRPIKIIEYFAIFNNKAEKLEVVDTFLWKTLIFLLTFNLITSQNWLKSLEKSKFR